jgi:two-component system, OmpR family, sensor histidine kinase KdpD
MSAPQMPKTIFALHGFGARFGVIGLRIVGALAAIAGITVICSNIAPISAGMAGFLYLAVIAVVATGWGRLEGGATSAAALLCLDYFFLSPLQAFAINRPATIEGCLGFLIAAIAVILLAPRSPGSEDSIDRQREMESLYALSRAILLMDPVRPVAKQMAYQIARIFKFPAVVLYDRSTGETLCAGPEDMPCIDDKLREAAVLGTLFQDRCYQTVVTAVRLGGDPIGSVALRGAMLSDSALQALTNLVAIGLERARGREAAQRAEAARQSQDLKATLLDAIAQEFKTPLTSIKAAATALLSGSFDKVLEKRELISIVDEEADRLSRLVNDAILMARLESAKTQVARDLHPICVLVDAALSPIRSALEGRELVVDVHQDLPLVMVDAELFGLAIRQLIDYALKDALPNTPITIHATAAEGKAFICVSDQGAGISAPDQGRDFEKLRLGSKSHRQVITSATEFVIARKIVEVHGGEISVESRPGEATEVVITLPAASQQIPA